MGVKGLKDPKLILNELFNSCTGQLVLQRKNPNCHKYATFEGKVFYVFRGKKSMIFFLNMVVSALKSFILFSDWLWLYCLGVAPPYQPPLPTSLRQSPRIWAAKCVRIPIFSSPSIFNVRQLASALAPLF